MQYPRDSTVVRWKLEQGVVQPTWTDLVLLIAFLMQNFFFNILLHVPCDFMGHIWLFSTVKGCVLWLIKMCPKYMVYFFRIWTEKNQFNSKSWLVCLSGENRGLWSPWVTIALRQLLTCVIIGLPHLDVKADCQSLSSAEPTLTCRRSSINLLNVLNLGLAREHQLSLFWSLPGLHLCCGRYPQEGWQGLMFVPRAL